KKRLFMLVFSNIDNSVLHHEPDLFYRSQISARIAFYRNNISKHFRLNCAEPRIANEFCSIEGRPLKYFERRDACFFISKQNSFCRNSLRYPEIYVIVRSRRDCYSCLDRTFEAIVFAGDEFRKLAAVSSRRKSFEIELICVFVDIRRDKDRTPLF